MQGDLKYLCMSIRDNEIDKHFCFENIGRFEESAVARLLSIDATPARDKHIRAFAREELDIGQGLWCMLQNSGERLVRK